jgi:hypothetical protein
MWWTGLMKLLQPLRNYCNRNKKFGQGVERVECGCIKFEARNTKFEIISNFEFSKHILDFYI